MLVPPLASCTRSPQGELRTVELVHRITGRQDRESITYGPDGVRFVRPDGTYLLRYADRTVFVLNAEEKTYEETGLDAFVARQKQRERQPDLPDLDGSVGAGTGIEIESNGQRTSIGGVGATLTRVRGGNFEVEIWLSDELAPPGPRRATFEFLQALGGPLALPAVLFDAVKGFPVRSTVRVAAGPFGEIKVTRALISVERDATTGDPIEVPPGFRRSS